MHQIKKYLQRLLPALHFVKDKNSRERMSWLPKLYEVPRLCCSVFSEECLLTPCQRIWVKSKQRSLIVDHLQSHFPRLPQIWSVNHRRWNTLKDGTPCGRWSCISSVVNCEIVRRFYPLHRRGAFTSQFWYQKPILGLHVIFPDS